MPDAARADRPRVAVFAPAPVLVCTFEHPHDQAQPDVALNVGGQGPWVARAANALGAHSILVVPLGGDTGAAARHLLSDGPYELRVVGTTAGTACYIEERRRGERTCVRDAGPGRLGQRELDDLYSAALGAGLSADVCVITGSPWTESLDSSIFTRLTADLAALGRTTVVDLSGEQLVAALNGGADWVKVAHDELDLASTDPGQSEEEALWDEAARISQMGTRSRGVILSRSVDAPSLVVADGRRFRVHSPALTTVDARGSGDTMAAALATGLGAGRRLADVLAWAAAAGAANAVHKGSATPSVTLVEQLATAVVVDEVIEPTTPSG